MGAQQSSASSASPLSASSGASASSSSASPLSASSTSPLSLSPTPSPSRLCEFSKKQAEEFTKEIKLLENSEVDMRIKAEQVLQFQLPAQLVSKMFHLPTAPFEEKNACLEDPNLNHPLLIKRILCLELIDILKRYRDALKKITALCEKCQTEEALENVDDKINELMRQFEEGLGWFNLFIAKFQKGNFPNDEYGTALKDKLVKTTSEMNRKFENVENIKSQMKAICQERDKSRELRSVAYSARIGIGGRTRNKRGMSKKQKLSRKQKTKKNKKGAKR